jgi:protoheme IX farnesyltransferase
MALLPEADSGRSPFFMRSFLVRLRLAKTPLCLLLSFSSVFGFVFAAPQIFPEVIPLVVGVLLLAGGGATLNSLQEWRQDSAMVRTRNRPLPQGELTLAAAAWQAFCLILLGVLFLSFFSSFLPVATGLLALLLYNGVYTPLKQKTVLAVLPGALSGALPPLIGWFAGGGPVFSSTALLLLLLLILWQIPHYWLVVLRYSEDYSSGRMPSMLGSFSEKSLRRLLIPWIAALAAAMLLFAVLAPDLSNPARWTVVFSSILMFVSLAGQLHLRPRHGYRILFIMLNVFFFFNMLVICGSKIDF